MSRVFSELGSRFKSIFDARRKMRKEIDALALRLSLLEKSSTVIGGSAHAEGLNLDPPFVMVKITELSGAMWQGQRIIPVNDTEDWNLEAGKWEDDEDDTKPYFIEPGGPCHGLPFFGAYCLIRMAYTKPWTLSEGQPDVSIYHVFAGEPAGFLARITDAPSVEEPNLYPWEQLYVHDDNQLRDDVEGFNGVPYGKARLLGTSAVDPVITAPRIIYPIGTHIWLRAGSFSGDFWFSAFADAEHASCPF